METWLALTLLFVSFAILMIFVFRLEWVIRRRKTIKRNNLTFCASGYAILYRDDDKSTIVILSGFLGQNSKDLIFEHHIYNSTSLYIMDLSSIRYVETSEYNEHTFLEFVRRHSAEDKKIGYVMEAIDGLSYTRFIPRRIQKHMLCQIKFNDGVEFCFSYKNTADNAAAIDVIRQSIRDSKEDFRGLSDGYAGT